MFDAFQFELTRPWALWGCLLLFVLAVYYWRSLVDFDRWQRRVSLACRIVIVVLLILSLAGLNLMTTTDRQFVVFVADASKSVGDQSAKIRQFLDQARSVSGDHEVAYLAFAEKPGQVLGAPGADWPRADDDEGTDAAAAIEVAAAAIPPFFVPQIVLLSDGNETAGDVLKAALAARIPISAVPLATRDDPEAQISSVQVPAQVRQGEPFHVEVTVDSNRAGEGTIEIYRDSFKIASEKQTLKKGANLFRFRQTVDGGRAEYAARITGFEDTLLDNNTASGLIFASGKPRVLVIDSEPKTMRHLVWGLDEQDIQVDLRPPEGTPESLSELQNYEAVILSNVPATSLSIRQMETMRTYVQDLGGGLIMLGGDQSFGLGGYYKTTLEEILPVRSNFEKEKEKPSLAMVLIVDKSGSMGGAKIQLAKDAASGAVELLGPRDQIGVIAFDGASYWVSEVHSAADKAYVVERIRTIEASGGTAIYPALEDAFAALTSTVAKLKHVILLTDGHSSPGDFEGITTQMSSARITVSTVAVGNGADQPLLENIARIGNGRYYYCDDPQSVPQIFAKETVTASKSAINELPFLPQIVRPTQVLSELDLDAAPFLMGFVVTRAKPTSEFILASESGEPLLVWWRYGLGMTAAFTSDAKSQWASEWVSWPGFGKFWAQVIRHVMRKSDAKGVFVEVERSGGRTRVVIDAVDAAGRYRNSQATRLTVIDPALQTDDLLMDQIAPGRYRAEFASDQAGTYHLKLSQSNDVGQATFQQSRGLVVGYPDELRLRPINEPLLQKIAQVSGGQYNPAAAAIFDNTGRTARHALPLWSYLLIAALVLFVADVALRRIDLGRGRNSAERLATSDKR